MSKCASHKHLGGRIPSSLLDTYVQYKRDTRAAIAWLVSHGTSRYKDLQTLSIADLFSLADIVCKKAVEMPDIIDFHFREAIAARKKLTKYFRHISAKDVDDEVTINHEYFTSRFKEIHAGLCLCCVKPAHRRRYETPNDERTRPEHALSAQGPVPEVHHELGGSHDEIFPCHCECHDSSEVQGASEVSAVAKESPRLVDDVLCEAFELRKEIQDMEDLLGATVSSWEQAANGDIPLVVAVFTSNAVFADFEALERRLRLSCDITNPDVLYEKSRQFSQEENAKSVLGPGAQQMIESLGHTWGLLRELQVNSRLSQGGDDAELPPQLNLSRQLDCPAEDHKCIPILLQNIDTFIRGTWLQNGVLRIGTPIYPEVGYLMTHPGEDSNGLRCCYGLRLLLASYKGYLFGSELPCAPSSCRLQALQYAQEAVSSISAILDDDSMPCRCPGTLAFHLDNLQIDFKYFLQARIFDFYFQAPWVSGSHILEMLEALFYYGLRLLSYRHYIGALLHAYNVLQQFADIAPVPLLETLSTTFSDIIYPGGRPRQNFKTCYIRSMGGRLRFGTHGSSHRSGCHSMAIPSHVAKATAGFGLRRDAKDPRFDYRKLCLVHHIKERGYHLDEQLWDRIRIAAERQSPTTPDRDCHIECNPLPNPDKIRKPCSHDSLSSVSPHERLQTLQNAVLRDFTGPFPIARINLLEVYLACVRTVAKISDRYHGPHGRPGQNCLCFVEALLEAADRSRAGRSFGCKELVGICKSVMVEELGSRKCEEFLWKGIK